MAKDSDKSKHKSQSKHSSISHLDDEDARLWQQVASSVSPLDKKQRDRISDADDVLDLLHKESRKPLLPKKSTQSKKQSSLANTSRSYQSLPSEHNKPETSPPLADFNRKEYRQVGSEQKDIEARLDLHGLSQDQAYGTLKSFLSRCQSQGKRYVLVITGKGGRRPSEDDNFYESQQTSGVLKQAVPQWLGETEFRSFVVSFTTAQRQHGGEGALYVRLRKIKRKSKS